MMLLIHLINLKTITNRSFCSNMDLSDHAHIFHAGVFEGEEFNKKKFPVTETNGSRDNCIQKI